MKGKAKHLATGQPVVVVNFRFLHKSQRLLVQRHKDYLHVSDPLHLISCCSCGYSSFEFYSTNKYVPSQYGDLTLCTALAGPMPVLIFVIQRMQMKDSLHSSQEGIMKWLLVLLISREMPETTVNRLLFSFSFYQ